MVHGVGVTVDARAVVEDVERQHQRQQQRDHQQADVQRQRRCRQQVTLASLAKGDERAHADTSSTLSTRRSAASQSSPTGVPSFIGAEPSLRRTTQSSPRGVETP